MKNKLIFIISAIGILLGLISAYIYSIERKAQPPMFKPVSSPYASAIYANGIIESEQPGGSNIVIFPEVPGVVARVMVAEGQKVAAGTPLLQLDDSVQKASTEQLRLQSEASLALLNELKAQPRKETLEIARAQVDLADANLKIARDQYDKRRSSYDADHLSISKDVLDTAANTLSQAQAALDVARRQYELTKAGAWTYDIQNQEKIYASQKQAYEAANALLQKYLIKAHSDATVMAVNAAVGSYVSTQGAYDSYSQGVLPLIILGNGQDTLAVRCYIDEILISQLPDAQHIRAEMSIRGTDTKVPLEFVRVQPYVSPKLELSNQRQEKVDLRVLPVIFRFSRKNIANIYPGQLVDVYIGKK